MGNQPGKREEGFVQPVPTADDLDTSKGDSSHYNSARDDTDYGLVSTTESKLQAPDENDEADPVPEPKKDTKAVEGPPTIHRAADKGHAAMVQFLIDNKAQVDALNAEGWTALHCAVYNGHKDVVKVLIKNKAFIDFPFPNNFSTCLHWASGYSDLQMVQLLVNCRAEVNARDKNMEKPIDYAKRSSAQPIIDYLLSNPAPIRSVPNSPGPSTRTLESPVSPKKFTIPDSIKESSPNPNHSKSEPNTPTQKKRQTSSIKDVPTIQEDSFSKTPKKTTITYSVPTARVQSPVDFDDGS